MPIGEIVTPPKLPVVSVRPKCDESVGVLSIEGERWRVDASHLARHNLACHREPINQKAFGPTHQCKSVTGALPVVEKFVAVGAFEAGYAERKLQSATTSPTQTG